MQEIATRSSARDSADLAAYYSILPTGSDSLDKRWFPQAMRDASRASMAIELIVFGEGAEAYRRARHAMVRLVL
jgi:hypothetical protein